MTAAESGQQEREAGPLTVDTVVRMLRPGLHSYRPDSDGYCLICGFHPDEVADDNDGTGS